MWFKKSIFDMFISNLNLWTIVF